jgi:hypothetical protein
MHTRDIRPEDVRFVLLKNKKGFDITPGTFREDGDTFSFDYVDVRRGSSRQRITVDRDFVATLEGGVPNA